MPHGNLSRCAVLGLAIGAVTCALPVFAENKPPPSPSASSAEAKPAKAPPSKEVLQKYLQQLGAGRAADGKGQLQEARRAFEEAVRTLPEGAAAQSELGWLAYRQKDLPVAERATRAAIAAASKPSLRAASLYNLGKILADQGKKPEATKAFLESWEIGQNPAVLTELRTLDPTAAQTAWPRIAPLDGPIKLPDSGGNSPMIAACRAQLFAAVSAQDPAERMMTRAEIDELPVDSLHCKQHPADKPGGAGPAVMVLSAMFSLNHYELDTIAVWVKTREGWLYRVIDASVDLKWSGEKSQVEKVSKIGSVIEIRKQVTGRDEGETASYYKGGQEQGQAAPSAIYETNGVAYYLGFGPSGQPGLSAGVRFATSRSVEPVRGSTRSAEKVYPVALTQNGELQISAPQISRKQLSEKEFSGRDLQTPVGTFPLKFP